MENIFFNLYYLIRMIKINGKTNCSAEKIAGFNIYIQNSVSTRILNSVKKLKTFKLKLQRSNKQVKFKLTNHASFKKKILFELSVKMFFVTGYATFLVYDLL